ncbi:dioxygenase [Anaplasmataceae bacterium AB001_6]|nr:dioxygenase [Anaplasmataceae bacterium AB001_6]
MILCPDNLFGEEKYDLDLVNRIIDPILMQCELTPEFNHLDKGPEKFVYSNNLRRKAGSPYVADGLPIRIMGRVLDSNCIPIANVIVKIWHTNNKGIYQFEQIKKRFPVGWDRYFNGSGIAVTDNLGYYNFTTVYPHPESDDAASVVNFIAQHREFIPLRTIMFFNKENKERKLNSGLSTIPSHKRHLLNATMTKTNDVELTFEFNIILKGINKIYEQDQFDRPNTVDPIYLEKFNLKKEAPEKDAANDTKAN